MCIRTWIYICIYSTYILRCTTFPKVIQGKRFNVEQCAIFLPDNHIYQRKSASLVELQTIAFRHSPAVSRVVYLVFYWFVYANFFLWEPENIKSFSIQEPYATT